jgi:hypothetical protein
MGPVPGPEAQELVQRLLEEQGSLTAVDRFSARHDVARRAHCLQRAAGPAGAEVSRRERSRGDAGDEENRGDGDGPPTDATHHYAPSTVRPGVARITSRTA